MADVLKHKFVSGKAASADTTKIDGPNWDDEHAFSGGSDGDVLVRDTGESDGATFRALTKSDVGLGNVDNTSDANKPISTATQTALDTKVPTTRTVNGHALSGDVAVAATDLPAGPNGIGTTSTDGLVLQNTTDAAAGAQQYSPRLRLRGEGWRTNATAESQPVDFILEVQPVQGSAAPTANLVLRASINGGAYATVGTFGSGGEFVSSLIRGSGNVSLTIGQAGGNNLDAAYFGSGAAGVVFANASRIRSGAGSPENVVSAAVGSLWLRSDGGAGTTLYVKESGTGNTGWVAK